MRKPILLVLALFVCFSLQPVSGAKKTKREVPLPDGFPALTEQEISLTTVPGGGSAPAVVLFEAMQNQWEGFNFVRVHYYRRVKILGQDGVERYGDFVYQLYGDWRVKKVDARTVLPGGEQIDASEGVFHERSTDGFQTIRVAWPRVEVGAILDLHLSVTADAVSIPPWIMQGPLPVLESRFVIIPPPGLKYRVSGLHMSQEATKPRSFNLGQGRAHVWTFENLPALPDEPNQMPRGDISQTLLVIPQEYRDPETSALIGLARDWKTWSYWGSEAVDAWIKERDSATQKLATEVTAEKSDPREKAEAIREALRERVQVEYLSDGVIHDSPDEVLSKGSATTGELARTAVAMLRSVGVEADAVAVRLRTSGVMPAEFPVPALFEDLVIRMKDGKETLMFSPAADLPVGTLPWNRRGILGLPLDGSSTEPIEIDDFSPEENRTMRIAAVKVDDAGALTGKSTHTHFGVAAERWRGRLKDLSDEERRQAVEQRLQRWMPGLTVRSLKIENLESSSDELIIEAEWEVEAYGTAAGKRLLVNTHLFERVDATDWPAVERKTDVDLGEKFESYEKVELELPEGVAGLELPEEAVIGAKGVGLYRSSQQRQGGTVTIERQMRLGRFWYPVESYAGLRRMFLDMAKADDTPLAIRLR